MSLVDFGWDDGWARAFGEHAPAGSEPARVTAELGPFLRVMVEAGELLAERSGRLRHDAETRSELPVVGDWVALRRAAGAERGQVVAVLPRRSRFARKAAGEDVQEQVLAANIDTVFLVAGLDRDFNPRRLERALLLARENGATPVVVLNKSDLAGDPEARRREIEAVAQGAPVIVTAAKAGLGLGDLAPFLQPGRTVALLGSSGVGKSTLINRLLGFEKQRTRDVREVDSRGRHTTTHRELVLLPEGGVLIDTPGMRELQLWASEQSLGGTFDDVVALGAGCGFRDCAHQQEPRCAVRAAVERGDLAAERLASYQKLMGELRHLERQHDVRARADERRKWRTIHKTMRAVNKRR